MNYFDMTIMIIALYIQHLNTRQERGIVQNMDWTGLDWTGLDWTGLDWTGQLDWTIGLDSWTGQLDWTVGLGPVVRSPFSLNGG